MVTLRGRTPTEPCHTFMCEKCSHIIEFQSIRNYHPQEQNLILSLTLSYINILKTVLQVFEEKDFPKNNKLRHAV
jgi:hypothetical protein